MTKTKDAVAIAKMTLGLLFASAFQVPMVSSIHDQSLDANTAGKIALFCVYRICKHPEYHDKLQSEAVECKDLQFSSLNHEMPYLDSFIKETSRLSPGPICKSAIPARSMLLRQSGALTKLCFQKSAIHEQLWSIISLAMAAASLAAIGSLYLNSRSCVMRVSGHTHWNLMGSGSSMK